MPSILPPRLRHRYRQDLEPRNPHHPCAWSQWGGPFDSLLLLQPEAMMSNEQLRGTKQTGKQIEQVSSTLWLLVESASSRWGRPSPQWPLATNIRMLTIFVRRNRRIDSNQRISVSEKVREVGREPIEANKIQFGRKVGSILIDESRGNLSIVVRWWNLLLVFQLMVQLFNQSIFRLMSIVDSFLYKMYSFSVRVRGFYQRSNSNLLYLLVQYYVKRTEDSPISA